MFKAFLAAGWLLAATAAAHAGIVSLDQKREAERATVEEAYAKLAFVRDGLTPLVDYSAAPTDRACTPAAPKTYAVLIGVDAAGTAHNLIVHGAQNDADLLAAALDARLKGQSEIILLKGSDATRDSVRQTLLKVLAKLNCHDMVIFSFAGVGGFFGNQTLLEATTAGADLPEGDPSYAHAAMLRKIADARAMFMLSSTDDSELQPISAPDISDFVTHVRNRGADAMVVLDAIGAGETRLLERQRAVDPLAGWQVGDVVVPAGAATLAPVRGDFVLYTGKLSSRTAIERKFAMPDGSEVIHGEFTFALATALQDNTAFTAEGFGQRLMAIPDQQGRGGTFFSEGSSPDMRLFDRSAQLAQVENAIVVTSPEPTRGPASVQSAVLSVTGVVDWTQPVTAVLVDGEPADLDATGHFTHRVNLVTGANTIKILALTRDSRLLQKTLEINFGGDVAALKGTGRSYAVIIANADYGATTGFDALGTPIADADALAATLANQYGFVTEAKLANGSTASFNLRNASGRDIAMALYNVSQVAGSDDTVLIYYAGHGIYEPLTTTAFWVPIDAVAGVPPTYLSASTISEAIARIQARKVVLISDSCFSGALLRGGPEGSETIDKAARVNSLLALARGKSRLLISSGNNEPVSDAGGQGHSVFAQALLNGLANEPDDQFSARELFDGYILTAVMANSRQEPQFRPLDNVGHEGGDVIFVRKKS